MQTSGLRRKKGNQEHFTVAISEFTIGRVVKPSWRLQMLVISEMLN
jgi:hypothetical protein